MFKTIVVGVDGREGGRDALSLAARLARIGGGDLIAVRVLSLDYYFTRSGAPAFTAIAKRDAKRDLERELAEAAIEAELRVLDDASQTRALHRVAEEAAADLIVIGSTSHNPIGRVFIGDHAAGTLHGSPCPVAVAPHGLAGRERLEVERIGVGFDGGPEATQALAFAARLARDGGARLVIRFVVPSSIDAVALTAYDPDWLNRATHRASEVLARAVAGLDVEATGDLAVGSPVEELVDLSEAVDLLVVGSRGWGPVRRTLAGGTAVGLMRKARSPVLIVPRGAATGQPGERRLAATEPAVTT
jgi:nucleotide-binding universal stress UspA family protein